MIDWFNALDPLLRTFWGIALFFSLFFLVQNIMTLIGIGSSDADGMDGLDAAGGIDSGDAPDGDTLDAGGAMQLFTIRNLVNFMLGIGWGGVCFWQYIPNRLLLCLVAIVFGLFFLFVFYYVWRKMLSFEKHGNLSLKDSIGSVCSVYLRIPPSRTGQGKVQVSFGGSVQEIAAITDHHEQLPSGSKVRVEALVDSSTLLVAPL
ncbi:MAG: hypothetical protein KBT12_02195 [Bacteroidales bacterium]|nr:hypothetical protein [Candidatus Physcousia equi]